jgi:peptidoglycan/LPS O-acetylase OafA/YrhL
MPADSRVTEKYRPDIDGLRAIAVGAVVAFHAFPNFFKGGFVGVDIFFVISGYLISGIIVDAVDRGTFSYLDFYVRRVRRIFPALVIVVAATMLSGWYVLLPDEFARLGKHLAAGAFFATNFVLWDEVGYFDALSGTKPLLHLWSLAIEEQFYILWPLILSLVWKRKGGLLLATLSIAAVSFALNVITVGHDPVAAFYAPWARFWELMLGGALAYLVRQKGAWLTRFQTERAGAGLLLIGTSVFMLSPEVAFPGYWALIPTVGTFLAISAGFDNWIGRYILGNRLMAGIGLISYPLYLWHWPILVFAKIVKGSLLTPLDRAAAIAAAVALAFLTYHYIETPIRRASNWRLPPALAGVMAGAGALGLLIFTGGIDSRLRNEHITQILAAAYDWQYPPVAAENHAFGDIRYFRENSELGAYTLFLGDSNMEQYAPRIDWAIKYDPGAVDGAILVGNQKRCDFVRDIITGVDRCPEARAELQSLIDKDTTHAVAVAASWSDYRDALANPANRDHLAQFLHSIATRKRVYLILNIPNGEELAPQNMFAGSRLGTITAKPVASISFDFAVFEQKYGAINQQLAAIAESSGATVIDPIPYLCPENHCPVFDEHGTPLYLDAAHLTRAYAIEAATYIDATLRAQALRPRGRAQ